LNEKKLHLEDEDIDITGKDLLLGFLLFFSLVALFLMSASSLMVHNNGSSVKQNGNGEPKNGVTPDRLPIEEEYLGYAKVQYNYEWGAFNYATGKISVNVSMYWISTDSPQFEPVANITTQFNGAATNSSYSFGSYYGLNATNGDPMWIYSVRQGFSANDFFQSNTDNVHIVIHVTSAPSATTQVNASSNTVIDWKNILNIAITVAGS